VPRQKSKTETDAIRQLIDRRLKSRLPAEVMLDPFAAHLDEDAICAFVEGRLEDAEAAPVTSHLVACSFCRHTTAQLIKLESQFDSRDEAIVAEGPGRVRLFLESLAARMAPSLEEDAVFAYQNPETEPGRNAEVAEEVSEKPEDSK
jgi:hypothetical protein